MADETIAGIMREFNQAVAAGEVDKALAYFADDASWVLPGNMLKGKEAIKGILVAMARNFKDMKITETGHGIITQGDKAFFERTISGLYQGQKFEFLDMCAYEFSGDKIKAKRQVYDRLLISQQTAKGWPAKPIVNMVVSQSDKAMK